MPRTIKVPVSEALGEGGAREAVGAAGREPIRRDEERVGREAFEWLKAELQHAFAAPEKFNWPAMAHEVQRSKRLKRKVSFGAPCEIYKLRIRHD